jgi:hypothetical protein
MANRSPGLKEAKRECLGRSKQGCLEHEREEEERKRRDAEYKQSLCQARPAIVMWAGTLFPLPPPAVAKLAYRRGHTDPDRVMGMG